MSARPGAGFPFMGIVDTRPYPPTGLTTARWMAEVPTRLVAFRDLWLTQKGVRIRPMFGLPDSAHRSSDWFPHCVTHNGQLYLEDGHHRVVRNALTGRMEAMVMRVFRPGA